MVTVDESGGDDSLSSGEGVEVVAAHTAGGVGVYYLEWRER